MQLNNIWNNKKVLITGIKGFVAPYLAEKLLNLGSEVYGIDLPGEVKRHPLKHIFKNIKIFEGNLTEKDFVFRTFRQIKPDFIFHLAAKSSVRKSFEDPYGFLEVNCIGTLNLLDGLKQHSIPCTFIFAGSSDEYGTVIFSQKQYQNLKNKYGKVTPSPLKIPELPVNEDNPLRPLSPYALTKIYGDFLTRQYSTFSEIKGIVSRAFNHEGPGRGKGFVSTDIIEQIVDIKKGITDEVKVGNIIAMRDWSHVKDIIKGYLLIAEKGKEGNIYNIGSGKTNSVLSFILLSLECAGFETLEIQSEKYPEKKVEKPLEPEEIEIGDFKFKAFKIDKLILDEEINFGIEDEKIIVKTHQKNIKIKFAHEKFRPTDIPVLLCDNTRIKNMGFKVKHDLKDIIKDLLDYRLSSLE